LQLSFPAKKNAAVILESSPKCSRYISPSKIQKEILGIYVMEVREHIRHEIGGFKVLYSS
jgi:hypothetical protein